MSEQANHVVVVDLKMPFWSMVVFMVKWAIAAIPAILILYVIVMALVVAVPSAIQGYSGYVSRASASSCIEKGVKKMGANNAQYVKELCDADPSIADSW